jgi:hypothetical protein
LTSTYSHEMPCEEHKERPVPADGALPACEAQAAIAFRLVNDGPSKGIADGLDFAPPHGDYAAFETLAPSRRVL